MTTTCEDAARILHAAYLDNAMFPGSLANALTLDEAYAAQFHLLGLREADGEALAGWKVGLTSKAMQQQQGVHEPCLGHLLVSGQRPSPAAFDFADLHGPGFENELCIRMAAPLDGGDHDLETVAAAIDAVAPALEIIEKRSALGADIPLAMAGNAQQLAYVTGGFVPFSPDMDLSAIVATVTVNGQPMETATGAEVLGTPLQSVRWLAGKLAQFGRRLEAGALIMSGSFTKQYAIAADDRIETTFDGIGTAAAAFD